jgi:hypothetical protein
VLPREGLALALHRLGSKGEAFRTGNIFGRGDSTAAKWVDVVCHAIVTEFSNKVALPDAPELKTLVNTMMVTRGFPMAWGAEDGKFFEVRSTHKIQI